MRFKDAPPYRLVKQMRALGFKQDSPNRRFEDKTGERDSVPFSEVETWLHANSKYRPEGGDLGRGEQHDLDKELVNQMVRRGFTYDHHDQLFQHPFFKTMDYTKAREFVQSSQTQPVNEDIYLQRALDRLRQAEKARMHGENYGMGASRLMALTEEAAGTNPIFAIDDLGGLWAEMMEVELHAKLEEELPLHLGAAEFEEAVQKIKRVKGLQMHLLRAYKRLVESRMHLESQQNRLTRVQEQLALTERAYKERHEGERLRALRKFFSLLDEVGAYLRD
jgi:hypothetical protein